MIKPRAINAIAYKPSDKRNRSRMERGLYDGYNSLPGEVLTFTHAYYRRLPHIKSDKRQLWGAQNVYHSGICGPNYPMPAIRTEVCLFSSGLSIAIIEWKGTDFNVLHYWEDLSHYVQHNC